MQKQIQLPSHCRAYAGVDPNQVLIRTFTTADEEFCADFVADSLELKFQKVLERVLVGPVKAEDLTLGDRAFLLVWEAMNSYTSKLPLEFSCGRCGAQLSLTTDLSKLEIKELSEDYREPFMVRLPSGQEIKLRVLRLADEVQAQKLIAGGAGRWLTRLALSVVDEKLTLQQKLDLLRSLDTQDTAVIRHFHEVRFWHGPVMLQTYECSRCQYQGQAQIPLGVELFFPTGTVLDGFVRDAVSVVVPDQPDTK